MNSARPQGEGDAGRGEEGRARGQATAFREAERRYQLRKDQVVVERKGRRRGGSFRIRPVDLSGVIDLEAVMRLPAGEAAAHPKVARLQGVWAGAPGGVYEIKDCPGLCLVPGALSAEEQRALVVEALTRFPAPPNRTNHDAALGPLPGLWGAALRGARLQGRPSLGRGGGAEQGHVGEESHRGYGAEEEEEEEEEASGVGSGPCGPSPSHVKAGAGAADGEEAGQWCKGGTGPAARSLLRKLRWATLGPQFDWSRRVYDTALPHEPLSELIAAPSQRLAAVAEHACAAGGAGDALGGFRPDAAIVNYYREGDTLGGHQDDAESCLDMPIVSLSVGCPAVLLVGGLTRDDPPVAVLLRSGDGVVMAGRSRRCFHGVPRVFAVDRGAMAGDPSGRGDGVATPSKSALKRHERQVAELLLQQRGTGGEELNCPAYLTREGAPEDFFPFAEYISAARINISARMV